MQSSKTRVAVLFGGKSAEHEVSLQSAANVIQYLDPKQFDVIPVGIDKQGNWFVGNDIFKKSLAENHVPKLTADNGAWFTPEWIGKEVMQEKSHDVSLGKNTPSYFDVVFPAVHGTFCEDGTLQGLLELANLPYVGCGVLASAICMDKDIAKKLVAQASLAVAPYIAVKHDKWLHRAESITKEVREKLHYPVFVKPANAGSSIGITKVKNEADLAKAVDEAFRFDTKILIEKALRVLELEVAVLESLDGNEDPIVSVVGEIKPTHEFYSYDAKYLDEKGADLMIPATASDSIQTEAREMAKQIFAALECEGMARVDLFYDLDTNRIVFNEINTLPGFTKISMYPKLMAASGVGYSDLLSHLIKLALKRNQQKKQLTHNM